VTASGHAPEGTPLAPETSGPTAASDGSGGGAVTDDRREAMLTRRLHRLIALGALAVLVAVAGIAGAIATSRSSSDDTGSVIPPASSSLGAGDRAPVAFTVARLGGGPPVDLGALLHGRAAVVNFFASWCPNCRSELGVFGTAARADAGRVQFLGIDTNETSPSTALALLRAADAHYPVALDPASEEIASAYGVSNLPATFFIDATGRVRFEVLGAEDRAALEARITALVKDRRAN